MRKERELVSLSDIKCKKIVNMIEEATKIILRFTTCVNYDLKDVQLEDPKILIERQVVNTYKYDENTHAPGYEYHVFWCYKYIDESQRIYNVLHQESYMWPMYMLFFRLSVVERIEDNAYKGGRFFRLYITANNTNEDTRIVSYNDNYPLECMLLINNIYKSICFINNAYVEWKKSEEIKSNLKEIETVEDIEDYISKITLK